MVLVHVKYCSMSLVIISFIRHLDAMYVKINTEMRFWNYQPPLNPLYSFKLYVTSPIPQVKSLMKALIIASNHSCLIYHCKNMYFCYNSSSTCTLHNLTGVYLLEYFKRTGLMLVSSLVFTLFACCTTCTGLLAQISFLLLL